jgi:hypothetical protein
VERVERGGPHEFLGQPVRHTCKHDPRSQWH